MQWTERRGSQRKDLEQRDTVRIDRATSTDKASRRDEASMKLPSHLGSSGIA